ncbi:MAG: nickel pincer cofactor biosynthesis protein LarB [Thermostichales cyanobacterium SZTDM-1c_bins_54]
MINADRLRDLIYAVAQGTCPPEQALAELQLGPLTGFSPVGDFAHLDTQRAARTGFPEAIWGQDKSPAQIAQLMQHLHQQGSLALATRVAADKLAAIRAYLPSVNYSAQARLCWLGHPPQTYPGIVQVVSAGTADLPVAEEAALTAELCGCQVKRLWDVGVAGIHRLLHHRQYLVQADVVVVVAGMEGALASLVGGLVACPVVAVPTSIGYGASFQGLAALLTMLNSCSSGIGVVNIDNGFGAGVLAAQILRTALKLAAQPKTDSNAH